MHVRRRLRVRESKPSGQPGDTEADDYVGSHSYIDDTPDLRMHGTVEGGMAPRR